MIAIIDYGAGNSTSVKNALDVFKVKSKITDNKQDIINADKIIFPGVGNFGDTVKALEKKGIFKVLQKEILKKPYLGICLGLQLLFESSEESPKSKGLGIFPGKVVKFKTNLKVPQIGWNSIQIKKKTPLLSKIKENSYFYFVHSYYVAPKDKKIIMTETTYGKKFVSGVNSGNISAIQFHPERSGSLGLHVLRNFIR